MYNIYTFCGVEGVTNLTTQIVPIPGVVQSIPGRQSTAINEVVFRALNIPPFGIKAYAVAKKTQEDVVEQSEPANFISNGVNKSNVIYNVI